jgi:hypothetical protein
MIKFIIGRGIGFTPDEPGYIVTHGFTDLSDGGGGVGASASTPGFATKYLLGL